ncbi:hypothetical protein ACFQVA_33715 [Actinomadura keratinilytica]
MVHRSGAQCRWPRVSAGAAASSSTPSVTAYGIVPSSAVSSPSATAPSGVPVVFSVTAAGPSGRRAGDTGTGAPARIQAPLRPLGKIRPG